MTNNQNYIYLQKSKEEQQKKIKNKTNIASKYLNKNLNNKGKSLKTEVKKPEKEDDELTFSSPSNMN